MTAAFQEGHFMTKKTTWLTMVVVLGGTVLVLAGRAPAGPLKASGQAVGEPTKAKTLAQAVGKRPFPDYAKWWRLGDLFSSFMSQAIVAEWSALRGNDGNLDQVRTYASEYLKTVYGREPRASLVDDFVRKSFPSPLQSGEFDALSYAFFRSAFDLIERQTARTGLSLQTERRLFTKRVGKRFFARLSGHLSLNLPSSLGDEASFTRLKDAVREVTAFLKEQGYFRDHAAFRFDVAARQKGGRIDQPESVFLDRLKRRGSAYALFEMSYPVILPSAVYLFEMVGEAQHHSSRTIEELFDRIGYDASETADFDPRDYPSDMVVELWEIRIR
jgi:hypothetical protein